MFENLIPNYHVIREIGRGGMATVYVAHYPKFDTNIAIKVLNKEFVHNENIRKRFLSEARNMFRMTHTNIVKVTDLIDENNVAAIVMEYIEGETLKDYLERKGKLNDEEIKTIFSQMLDAVGYVHSQNLVHRDIKPSNFMLDKKGKVKLLDFGIAKTINESSAEYTQTGTGVQMGTPMYMSPEQVKSTKDVTLSTDIYSLGVVLWQMLAGRKPYNHNELSVPEIQVSIIKEPLPILNHAWDSIIKKSTEKELNMRYSTTHIFLNALQNFESYKDDETIYDNNLINSSKHINESRLIKLAQISITGNGSLYIFGNIPEDKINNFNSRISNHLIGLKNVEYLIYFDATIFGKGDDGWAIFKTVGNRLFFAIAASRNEEIAIFTLNFYHKTIRRLKRVSIEGLIMKTINAEFENPNTNNDLQIQEYNLSLSSCENFFLRLSNMIDN